MTWSMWAESCPGMMGDDWPSDEGEAFIHIYPHHSLVKMCTDDEPVRVTVTEFEDGPYYGWIDARREDDPSDPQAGVPCMIQPREVLFRVQFPYGYEAEEKDGRGRMLRLRVFRTCV